MNQQTWLKPGGADLERAGGESSFPDYRLQLRNNFRVGKALNIWTALRHVAAVRANDNGGGVVPFGSPIQLIAKRVTLGQARARQPDGV